MAGTPWEGAVSATGFDSRSLMSYLYNTVSTQVSEIYASSRKRLIDENEFWATAELWAM